MERSFSKNPAAENTKNNSLESMDKYLNSWNCLKILSKSWIEPDHLQD